MVLVSEQSPNIFIKIVSTSHSAQTTYCIVRLQVANTEGNTQSDTRREIYIYVFREVDGLYGFAVYIQSMNITQLHNFKQNM